MVRPIQPHLLRLATAREPNSFLLFILLFRFFASFLSFGSSKDVGRLVGARQIFESSDEIWSASALLWNALRTHIHPKPKFDEKTVSPHPLPPISSSSHFAYCSARRGMELSVCMCRIYCIPFVLTPHTHIYTHSIHSHYCLDLYSHTDAFAKRVAHVFSFESVGNGFRHGYYSNGKNKIDDNDNDIEGENDDEVIVDVEAEKREEIRLSAIGYLCALMCDVNVDQSREIFAWHWLRCTLISRTCLRPSASRTRKRRYQHLLLFSSGRASAVLASHCRGPWRLCVEGLQQLQNGMHGIVSVDLVAFCVYSKHTDSGCLNVR